MGAYAQPFIEAAPRPQSPLEALATSQAIATARQNQQIQQQLLPYQMQESQAGLERAGLQNKLLEQEINDQRAMAESIRNWDPTQPSDTIIKDFVTRGGSGSGAMNLQTHLLDLKTKGLAYTSAERALVQNKLEELSQSAQGMPKLPDDQKQAAWTNYAGTMRRLFPEEAAQYPDQYPGDELMPVLANEHLLRSTVIGQEAKEASTKADLAKAAADQAKAASEKRAIGIQELQSLDPNDPDAYAAWKAKYPEISSTARYDPALVQRLVASQIPPAQQAEAGIKAEQLRLMQNLTPGDLEQMVSSSIDPVKYPVEYQHALGAARNQIKSDPLKVPEVIDKWAQGIAGGERGIRTAGAEAAARTAAELPYIGRQERARINAQIQAATNAPLISPDSPDYGTAQDLASGRLPFSNLNQMASMRGAAGAAYKASLYRTAKQINPNFNVAEFETGLKFAQDVGVKKQIAALDNVQRGVDDLLKFSDAASRSGAPVLNKWISNVGYNVGGKSYSNFRTAVTGFADELSGALGFGGATDMSKKMGFDMTDPNVSPETFRSNIQNVVMPFLARKRASLNTQMGPYGAGGAPAPGTQGNVGDQHVIRVTDPKTGVVKRYQYKGSGDTADLNNYTELK